MRKMGIEKDISIIRIKIEYIEAKLDKLLEQQQPKDRQDKEKAIKDTLNG